MQKMHVAVGDQRKPLGVTPVLPWADTSSSSPSGKAVATPTPLEAVPDTFASARDYVDTWFPLLLEELKAGTLSEVQAEGIGAFSKVMHTGWPARRLTCLNYHAPFEARLECFEPVYGKARTPHSV
jgi:hypothetical protein